MYFEMLEALNMTPSSEDKSLYTLQEAQDIGLDNFYSLINEAYIGKTKEILKIEAKIEEIREKYTTNQMKVNTSDELHQLEDLFCEAFGFECCSIQCTPIMTYNASTIPVSSIIYDFRDYNKFIDTSNKKMKYKKEAKVYVIITITKGLLFSTQFTSAEITAFLLHEVGHNFQTAISGKSRSLTMINKIFYLLIGPLMIIAHPSVGPFRNQYIDFITKLAKEKKELVDAYWAVNNFITTIISVGIGALGFIGNISAIMNPIAVLQKIPQNILKKLNLDVIFLPAGIKNEAVADAFPTMYGYGSELSSILAKMEKLSSGYLPDQMVRQDNIIGAYFDLIMLPNKIIANIFDPHPNTIARLKASYDYIQEELDKGTYNAKMKKELQKQLKDIEKSMDALLDAENKGFFFTNQYNKIVLMLFGGDIRHALIKGTNEEIDAAQARAEKQLEAIEAGKKK